MLADKPEVSVIMTVYNSERFISEAVTSVLRQTFINFELIIVDDGSTDSSVKIVQAFNDSRIRLYIEPHRGRAASLNYAVQMTRTNFFAFFDADDISVPTRLSTQFSILQHKSDVDIVGCFYEVINVEGEKIEKVTLPEKHSEIKKAMPLYCAVCFTGSMMRSRFFITPDVFDSTKTAAIDYQFFIDIIDAATFVNIPEVLIRKRVVTGQISDIFYNDQVRNTYLIALGYLTDMLHSETDERVIQQTRFNIALVEYCYGSKSMARILFYELLKKDRLNTVLWRYFIACLPGDSFYKLIRKKNISKSFRMFLPGHVRKKYFIS